MSMNVKYILVGKFSREWEILEVKDLCPQNLYGLYSAKEANEILIKLKKKYYDTEFAILPVTVPK